MEQPMLEQITRADRDIVERFTSHLIAAYEEFIDSEPEGWVHYADGFMAAHNFHKQIVLDLEDRVGDTEKFLRRAAVVTFETALFGDGKAGAEEEDHE
jgi:hypothetical protein